MHQRNSRNCLPAIVPVGPIGGARVDRDFFDWALATRLVYYGPAHLATMCTAGM